MNLSPNHSDDEFLIPKLKKLPIDVLKNMPECLLGINFDFIRSDSMDKHYLYTPFSNPCYSVYLCYKRKAGNICS